MVKIIDGKTLAEQVRQQVATDTAQIKAQGGEVRLAVVMVGDDPASQIYVRNKQRACEQVGISFELHHLPADCQYEDLVALIRQLNAKREINGVLLQLPIPFNEAQINQVLNMIDPAKDVDGLSDYSVGCLVNRQPWLTPCTAQGVVHAIQSVCPDLAGKKVVMVGRSRIVGRPTSLLLTNLDATVTVCHSRTKNLAEHTRSADIVVVAVGKPKLLTADMVRDDAIIIDVGINRLPDGSLAGDVDFSAVGEKARAITPVPRGIGPLTVAFLLKNLVTAYRLQNRG